MQAHARQRWFVIVYGWAALFGLLAPAPAAAAELSTPAQVRVMLLFKEVGDEGIQAAEHAMARAFIGHGYSVLNRDIVAQTLRREAYLLGRYESEAAKRLGEFLGADLVISGQSKVRVLEQESSLVGKFMVSQADVAAKAILVKSGREIVAEQVHLKKPFDTTGQQGLQAAGETLAAKMIKAMDAFFARGNVDYRVATTDANPGQFGALGEALRNMPGVQEVKASPSKELVVSVKKGAEPLFTSTLFGLAQSSEKQPGGLGVVGGSRDTIYVGAQPPALKPGYRTSWAVVIGINEYQRWPRLEYAVNDAQTIAQYLSRLGFNRVTTLLNGEATRQNILRVLGDELKAKTDREDRVFIFYAGHGQTEDLPNGGKEGYIIPVDGDARNYYSTAIKMGELQALSDRISAKHIFYAMDSCFSGLLMPRTRGESPTDPTGIPARQILTAGGEGEQVVELGGHGLFTKVLLAGLEGAADHDPKDGLITATELYKFLAPRVIAESRNSQTPQFGRLGQGAGEFVLKLDR